MVLIKILLLSILAGAPNAGVFKIVKIESNKVTINAGANYGVKVGDTGTIYYFVEVGNQKLKVFVANFKVVLVNKNSCVALITQKKAKISKSYLVGFNRKLKRKVVKRVVKKKKTEPKIQVSLGSLSIETEPENTKVFLNDKDTGKVTPCTISGLVPGTYKVKLVGETLKTEFYAKVEPNKISSYFIKLKQKMAELYVDTFPARAEVYIDGKKYGETPILIDNLLPGKHSVILKKEGYIDRKIDIVLEPGKRKKIDTVIIPKARLQIAGYPQDATVEIVGDKGFYTTIQNLPCKLFLMPGVYEITIKRSMFLTYKTKLELRPGEIKNLNVDLLKYPTISVVTIPEKAGVWLDNNFVGYTPIQFSLTRLPKSKTLKITLVKTNYKSVTKTVKIKPGEVVSIQEELKPKPTKPSKMEIAGKIMTFSGIGVILLSSVFYTYGYLYYKKGEKAYNEYKEMDPSSGANAFVEKFSDIENHINKSRTFYISAYLTTGIGVGLIVAGSVLWWKGSKKRVFVVPSVTNDYKGVHFLVKW